jgi:SAM-dependent methyltransferase
MAEQIDIVLAEQRRYYRARAAEYENWWYRSGRYEHGPESDARWFGEVSALEDALDRFDPRGRILELACGTGLWTERLAPRAQRMLALDASPEVIAIAGAKPGCQRVEFAEADIFAWEAQEPFDVVFFSFWFSHVPRELMAGFFAKVRSALAPGGRVFLIDSSRNARASARDHDLAPEGGQLQQRRLDDGREFTIVKHWFTREGLAALLDEHGWDAEVGSTGEFFLYAEAVPRGV